MLHIGTGKTRTLAALIEQIVRITEHNVLVCAMSNAACDEIAERLMGVLKKGDLLRFYASSREFHVSERLKEVSNFNGQVLEYPELEYIYKFRVVISTSCTAGLLSRARAEKFVWSPKHFGFVIIDECASAPEPVSLIPIAGNTIFLDPWTQLYSTCDSSIVLQFHQVYVHPRERFMHKSYLPVIPSNSMLLQDRTYL